MCSTRPVGPERAGTEGGEALSLASETVVTAPDPVAEGPSATGLESWYVLWTRSNCEQHVHDQLMAKGFDLFLPRVEVWSRRGGLRQLTRLPMFPGYLFLRRAMDKRSYIEVS